MGAGGRSGRGDVCRARAELEDRLHRPAVAEADPEMGRRLHGVGYVQISQIENGDAEPYPSTVRKLAQALGVAPHELMEPEDAPGQTMALATA
jgi:transcriptional regulator with XRE-family HTH domain